MGGFRRRHAETGLPTSASETPVDRRGGLERRVVLRSGRRGRGATTRGAEGALRSDREGRDRGGSTGSRRGSQGTGAGSRSARAVVSRSGEPEGPGCRGRASTRRTIETGRRLRRLVPPVAARRAEDPRRRSARFGGLPRDRTSVPDGPFAAIGPARLRRAGSGGRGGGRRPADRRCGRGSRSRGCRPRSAARRSGSRRRSDRRSATCRSAR